MQRISVRGGRDGRGFGGRFPVSTGVSGASGWRIALMAATSSMAASGKRNVHVGAVALRSSTSGAGNTGAATAAMRDSVAGMLAAGGRTAAVRDVA